MIQTSQAPAYYSRQPTYERPPTRFEHRTLSTSTRGGNRSPGELVRSWEAFDRLFEDAFAPVKGAESTQGQSQYTADNQTQSAFETPRPQNRSRQIYDETPSQTGRTHLYEQTPSRTGRTHLYEQTPSRTGRTHLYEQTPSRTGQTHLYEQTPSHTGETRLYEETPYQTGQTHLYEETPSRAGRPELYEETPYQTGRTHLYEETPARDFSTLFDDGVTDVTADAPLPGAYPKSYPLPDEEEDTPQMRQGPLPRTIADEPPSSADEDFQRLWAEAEANRKKRMTRTVTRRRILQHGMMSPGGTVSTMHTEPEHKLRRKKSRFHLYRNGNADYMTATFDLPDVRKEDVHVAFQSSQLTITWESTITTERRADDRTIIRERKERKYARTLPLPAGTEFPDIKAYLENGVLTVMYPKFSAANNNRSTLSITQ